MVIPIRDAQDRYAEWIRAIRTLEADLVNKGFTIDRENEFELGGEWDISNGKAAVAQFMWNVPHMLTLSVNGEAVVDEDYIKDIGMWREVVDYCMAMIIKQL